VFGVIARTMWGATKYLFLIVFSSIVGAHLGTAVGLAIGAIAGEPSWAAHGRCVGWTLFVLVAAIGAPFGFVYFQNDFASGAGKSRKHRKPQPVEGESAVVAAETIEGGAKAIVVAPLLGAFMGLIVGGMAGGLLVAFYFFAALSPLGPGGWLPILPLRFQGSADGFSANTPFMVVAWLIVVITFVVLGAIAGLFGRVSCGRKRYQVFRSKETNNSEGR
jgi:hypothetical protein